MAGMLLSEIGTDASLRVLRDGSFTSLGFVTHERPGLLVFLAGEEYLAALLENPLVSCVLTTGALAQRLPERLGVAVVDDARGAFYRLHDHLARTTTFYGAPEPTRVAASARVHDTAWVAPIGVELADGVELGPRVTILPGVVVGDRSRIGAGTILGGEGFQVSILDGEWVRVTHAGRVRIGRDVELHGNVCVNRSLFAETAIGDGTTIDDLVYVAHDVTIGRNCRIAAHAVINGSTRIGDGAWIGPGAVLSSELRVGSGAAVTLGSVVTRDVPPDARVTGNWAIDHERYLAFLRTIR
jgi:UDP-3-O-[3-hydroxymyristoyl] glucosamine N-acyltransferase